MTRNEDHDEEFAQAMGDLDRLLQIDATLQTVCPCAEAAELEARPIPGSNAVGVGWSHQPDCPFYDAQEVKPRR